MLGHLLVPSGGLTKEVLVGFLGESAVRIASLMGNWLRVGFAQGNFNADNCLVGGRTMDYGPFGWIDQCVNLSVIDRSIDRSAGC